MAGSFKPSIRELSQCCRDASSDWDDGARRFSLCRGMSEGRQWALLAPGCSPGRLGTAALPGRARGSLGKPRVGGMKVDQPFVQDGGACRPGCSTREIEVRRRMPGRPERLCREAWIRGPCEDVWRLFVCLGCWNSHHSQGSRSRDSASPGPGGWKHTGARPRAPVPDQPPVQISC